MDKQMTEAEKNGLLKNICVSEDKLEDYLNAITLVATQSQQRGILLIIRMKRNALFAVRH